MQVWSGSGYKSDRQQHVGSLVPVFAPLRIYYQEYLLKLSSWQIRRGEIKYSLKKGSTKKICWEKLVSCCWWPSWWVTVVLCASLVSGRRYRLPYALSKKMAILLLCDFSICFRLFSIFLIFFIQFISIFFRLDALLIFIQFIIVIFEFFLWHSLLFYVQWNLMGKNVKACDVFFNRLEIIKLNEMLSYHVGLRFHWFKWFFSQLFDYLEERDF